MWYTLWYAKTYLYPSIDRGRTAHPAGGVALVQCLCLATLSSPARQWLWSDRPRDWRGPGLRRPDCPQCAAYLQYPGAGGPHAPLLCPPADPTCGLRCAAARAVAGAAAPEPAHLWPRHQSVDLGLGRRGGVCRGPHTPTYQWRSDPPGAGTPRRPLEAGQTLDHQSRSRVHPKKKRRDRLMALAVTHPTWGLGFGDEVWWSRLAQPALHAWAPDEQGVRLVETTRPKADPEPKA